MFVEDGYMNKKYGFADLALYSVLFAGLFLALFA
jgi:hypothetical protein